MKITVKQLKQLIREQVEEMSDMGVDEGQTKAQKAAREAELQRMRDVGTKMRTDWEEKTSSYISGDMKIFKFAMSFGYTEPETVVGFGIGRDEKEAKQNAMERFPNARLAIKRIEGREISKEAFDKEQEKINERMEQLRAMEEYSRGVAKVSQELFGLGTNAENRNR